MKNQFSGLSGKELVAAGHQFAKSLDIHFAANRMLAAWGAGFIEATPGEAADVAGAVLSALEFLPRAQPDELKREYADKVISEIRTGESKQ